MRGSGETEPYMLEKSTRLPRPAAAICWTDLPRQQKSGREIGMVRLIELLCRQIIEAPLRLSHR